MKSALMLLVLMMSMGSAAYAQGLVIHASEFGVGKFHRYDNQVHPYGNDNAWKNLVLPNGAATDKPLVINNNDGSVTIFFSTLQELVSTVADVAQSHHQKISVFNLHGHGLPGAMWFPKDAATMNDFECADWKSAAAGADRANYDQYYSAVPPDEITQIRAYAENPAGIHMGCTVGIDEWKAAIASVPTFPSVFADDAQLHFLSCVVGLGNAGEAFTKGIASLLLKAGSQARVETSTFFGLGDWSMPEGMGFWDMVNEDQVNHDNSIYVVDRKDREIMQKGTVRLVNSSRGEWTSSYLLGQDFMPLSYQSAIPGRLVPSSAFHALLDADESEGVVISKLRVPGTSAYVRAQ